MKREIKFRGKSVSERTQGQWVYGNLITKIRENRYRCYIMPFEEEDFGMVEVDPETVGQFVDIESGSKDGLYENDFIRFDSDYSSKPNLHDIAGELVLEKDKWVLRTIYGDYSISDETDEFYYKSKVIGNRFDNPDLVKTIE